MLQPLHQGEAVHAGHMRVNQGNPVMLALLQRGFHLPQRRFAVTDRRRRHPPLAGHVFENRAIGGVIVHDQHRDSNQNLGSSEHRPLARIRGGGHRNHELEAASLSQRAIEGNFPAH